MDGNERESEVFERIPWESLTNRSDRRWLSWVVAGLLVMVGVGVSVGRSMRDTPPPAEISSSPATTAVGVATATTAQSEPAVASEPISEADLRAATPASVEWEAAVLAERLVVDFFTRDGNGERSFVEWSRAMPPTWTVGNTVAVEVLVRRIVALGDEAYVRVPDEAWQVKLTLSGGQWSVSQGPRPAPGSVEGLVVPEGETERWTDDAGLEWELAVPSQP